MSPTEILTLEALLEDVGEPEPQDVVQLSLRNKGLQLFTEFAAQLPQLECLSLSHNKLRALNGFNALPRLTILNINNNQLTSLEGLEACCALQELHAAGNMIRDVRPVQSLSQLRLLNCMKNAISSLDVTVQGYRQCIIQTPNSSHALMQILCQLPKLEVLDLTANPASAVPDAKHVLVAMLPALQTLDGETISDLDRQIAAEIFGEIQDNRAAGSVDILTLEHDHDVSSAGECPNVVPSDDSLLDKQTSTSDAKPSISNTAAGHDAVAETEAAVHVMTEMSYGPVAGSSRPATQSSTSDRQHQNDNPWATRPPTASTCYRPGTGRPMTASQGWQATSSDQPRPGTACGYTHKLVSEQSLNDHPLVLEYLAKHVLQQGLAVTAQGISANALGTKPRGGGYANRLRTAATVMSSSQNMDVQQLAVSGTVHSALSSGSPAEQAAAVLQGATPQELIRQLVRLAEVLISEVESLKKKVASRPSTPTSSNTSTCMAQSKQLKGRLSMPLAVTTATSRPGTAGSGSCQAACKQSGRPQSQPAECSKHTGIGTANEEPSCGSLSAVDDAADVKTHDASSSHEQPDNDPGLLRSKAPSAGADPGSVQGPVQSSEPGRLQLKDQPATCSSSLVVQPTSAEWQEMQDEVARLRREVKLLQVENQNVYWLADEVKRLRSQTRDDVGQA